MAENVLGVLFGEIAAAIRAKTGSTEKMTPAEFPEKIEAMNTSSGGSTVFTFYIGKTEYWADTGMTWAEWCASRFIHNMYQVQDMNGIGDAHGTIVDDVLSTDVIEPNRTYTITNGGMGSS